jgi:hypothetical protein
MTVATTATPTNTPTAAAMIEERPIRAFGVAAGA